MAGETSDLAEAFRKKVGAQTVLIERSYVGRKRRGIRESGTGVIFGSGVRTSHTELHIATAAHVLDDAPTSCIHWKISRLQWEATNTAAGIRAEFTTSGRIANESEIFRPADWVTFDIGCISIKNRALDPDGTYTSGRPFLDTNLCPLLKLSPAGGHLLTGTRVAWAGYPAFMVRSTGYPTLCYYEGVISASLFHQAKRPLYMVDGHAAPGVSGGPLWFCTPDAEPVIVGVVSSYEGIVPENIPGLCAFTPLNVLFEYLEKEEWNTRGSVGNQNNPPRPPSLRRKKGKVGARKGQEKRTG
jgi:hypothetical protein